MNGPGKKIIFGILTALIIATSAFAAQNIDVSFTPDNVNWQRNSVVNVSVVLTATSEAVSVAGVELHFNYDVNKFKGVPTIVQDNINSDLFVNDVSTASPNRVTYRKAISSPYYITVAPGSPFTAFVLQFRVTSVNAQEGTTSFNFDTVIDDVSNRAGSSVKGALDSGDYTIIADTTSPVILASPVSMTMNASAYQTIALQVSGADQSGDLQYIRYTIDGNDPKISGITYTAPVTIPQNTFTTLQFFGRDNDNNDSSTGVETYTVDTIYPAFSALTSIPSMARVGTVVTIDFTTTEPLQAAPTVRVAGNLATGVDVTYPTYTYRYTFTGVETQGSQNVSIQMTDLAGNATTNTSLQVYVDFKAPTYDPLLISPTPVVAGLPVNIEFRASERLSIATTVSILGLAASRTGETPSLNGTYIYTYTSPVLSGTEAAALIVVHGVDLAGNASNSNDGWGNITVTGYDVYNNSGTSTGNVILDYNEGP